MNSKDGVNMPLGPATMWAAEFHESDTQIFKDKLLFSVPPHPLEGTVTQNGFVVYPGTKFVHGVDMHGTYPVEGFYSSKLAAQVGFSSEAREAMSRYLAKVGRLIEMMLGESDEN